MSAAQVLLDRIALEGSVNGEVIKVDRFLNHMVDPQLVHKLAADLAARFAEQRIDKILTAETSGIMLAQAIAVELGVPFIYAKKKIPLTMKDFYAASSYSFTKQEATTLYVAKEVLEKGEQILFVDDIFAKGSTYKAIEEICTQSATTLIGCAVIINKSKRSDVEAILTLEDLQRATP
jgi:xanthine phosphoribosyltransferase